MDQPRVHVVPPFTPYYAPQADAANVVPVLCVVRNVACNVRAGFFKEFDENLLRRISEICYEDEIANLPYAPDVSDYMMSEDPSFVPNGNREIPFPEGMNGTEMERRLNRSDDRNMVDLPNPDMRPETSHPPITVLRILFLEPQEQVCLYRGRSLQCSSLILLQKGNGHYIETFY